MPEQPASQAAEPFEEPPREEIPGISRGHVQYMESSDAEEVWCVAGMHHVIAPHHRAPERQRAQGRPAVLGRP